MTDLPMKPNRICAHPGCPELTHGRYCEKHQKETEREYNRQRAPETWKRYDYRWKKIRRAYIAAHPLCEMCKREGRLTPAQEVHHVKPLSEGGTHATENLMALCTYHHSQVTAKEGGRWG